MENKKQLIIIPPMSEALKKLHEVLEGISADENMEITLIDDLRELGQFLATTGQCLVLASNAKKCATFLQENKAVIAKHHCKTILFTPKEIPTKTLIKFTKVGLTESILESSPPKTFLYKVKLLLRSIKTVKPQDDAEKTVKSLDANKTAETVDEKEIKDHSSTDSESVLEVDRSSKKKMDNDENVIDYANPLKGKVKPQEEVIDTHWKSNRKKDLTSTEDEQDDNLTAESELSSIDLYYRGKQKKPERVDVAEDEFQKLKKIVEYESEETEKKKKSSYADVIDEGTIKQKRLDLPEAIDMAHDKVAVIDLDLSASETKKKKREEDPEEEISLKLKRNAIESLEEEKKKEDEGTFEDLGGYLKGKITRNDSADEMNNDEDEDDLQYDNSDIESEKDKPFELGLLEADRKKNKRAETDADSENATHEGEVDKIDANMIGDSSTVDKIRTRMEGKSDDKTPSVDEGNVSIELKNKKKSGPENTESIEKEKDSLDLEKNIESKTKEKRQDQDDEDELQLTQKNQKLEPSVSEKKSKETKNELDSDHEAAAAASELELTPAEREKRKTEKREEDHSSRNSEDHGLDLEKSRENKIHNAQVDKIDTYYRSGESTKKKEHSWDNLINHDPTLALTPGKGKKGDLPASARGEGNDLGEQTIDYRKLKEEFDMISIGLSATGREAKGHAADGSLKNDDDEGSFKVVEIDPKSLDFSIAVINSIYQKDTKPKQIFAMLAEELVNNYHCYPVYYSYKLSDKKFTETYNSFLELTNEKISAQQKDWWLEKKKETALFEHFQAKSMSTWRCPEIVQNGEIWEDVELPSWAQGELTNKYVELIFPYYDGIDRMGMAVIFFPDGLNPKQANGILTVLEMARTLFLDTIQRYQVQPVKEERDSSRDAPKIEEKKTVLNFFGGLFGKKKAS